MAAYITGDRNRKIVRTYWPASLAESARLGSVRDGIQRLTECLPSRPEGLAYLRA